MITQLVLQRLIQVFRGRFIWYPDHYPLTWSRRAIAHRGHRQWTAGRLEAPRPSYQAGVNATKLFGDMLWRGMWTVPFLLCAAGGVSGASQGSGSMRFHTSPCMGWHWCSVNVNWTRCWETKHNHSRPGFLVISYFSSVSRQGWLDC